MSLCIPIVTNTNQNAIYTSLYNKIPKPGIQIQIDMVHFCLDNIQFTEFQFKRTGCYYIDFVGVYSLYLLYYIECNFFNIDFVFGCSKQLYCFIKC